MKRKFKILGLSMAVAAILALVIVGTVGAAGGNNSGTGAQTQNQGAECLCGECPCGNCACGDCDTINHEYNHKYSYSYSSPGPHGFQKGK
jgi:hypothetical protein